MAFIPELIDNTIPGDTLPEGAGKINRNFEAIEQVLENLDASSFSDSLTDAVTDNTTVGITAEVGIEDGKLNLEVEYGTTSGTACEGNDSRLSDARVPLTHTHDYSASNHTHDYSASNHTHDYAASDHDTNHVTGGSDEIDGDKLNITYTPSNYTSTLVSNITTDTEDLTSHLKGIDAALASAGVGDNSVTLEKLAHGTQGDILYYATDGAPTLLNAGTAGQVLTTNGADQNPTWTTVSSGGSGGIDPVTATAGEDLNEYDVVYLNSSNKIVKAICSSTATEANVLGLVSESGGILTDTTGDVTVLGTVTNVAWTWDANKWVYLSSVSGGLTQTIPTANGQYAVPVGIALSSDQIYIQPMTGWVVADGDVALGCKKISFDETSGTIAIVTPPANAVITQITAVITNAAAGSGGTIEIGVSGNTDSVVATTVFDLTQAGNHVYDPFYSVGGSPDEYILTVTAGGRTFDGIIYFHYAIPNTYTGLGGVASVSFTQATSSPALLVNLPENVVVQRCTVVVDTPASGGSPTVSIGTVGDPDLLFDETDCDLLTEGIYLYDPFVEQSGAIYLTITPDSESFSGRAYVQYMAVN